MTTPEQTAPQQKPSVPTTTAITPAKELATTIQRMTPEFQKALAAHVPAEKFARVALTAINKNPRLAECNRASLLAAFMTCAQDSLLPDGREAAIVPFKDSAQYLPMVAGILKKVRNSGELKSITAQMIHRNDSFKYWIDGDGEHLEHAPNMFSDRGAAVGVYALAKTKDGGVYIEVMTMDDIEKVRQVSRAKDSGPWRDWPEEMWKKTAIRRLSKRLPMSTDMVELFSRDDVMYEFNQSEEKEPAQPTSRRLTAAIEAKSEGEVTI